MSIAPAAPGSLTVNDYPGSLGYTAARNRQAGSSLPARRPSSAGAVISAERYASQKMFLEYESADGDKVSLRMESVRYARETMMVSGKGMSEEDWNNLVEKLSDEFVRLQQSVIEEFLEGIGASDGTKKEVDEAGEKGIEGLPEYWNAENTSRRIAEMALSFRGAFEGSDEEFLAIVKGAVDEGFAQAREILGEMPDEVTALTEKTYDMVMDRLDSWLARQQQTEEAAAAATA